MAGSSRTTAAKRQKERARQEKRVEKMKRREERKQQSTEPKVEDGTERKELVVTYDDEGQPQGFNFNDF